MKQKLEEFCESWSLDCRAIAIAAMMTSGLVAVGIIIVIATIAQTIKLTRRSNRAREYLNLKSTSEKQQDHDDKVLEEKRKREYYTCPNPSRSTLRSSKCRGHQPSKRSR